MLNLQDYNFPKLVQHKIKVINFLLGSYNISSQKKVLIILSHKLLKVHIFPHYYSNTFFYSIFFTHTQFVLKLTLKKKKKMSHLKKYIF